MYRVLYFLVYKVYQYGEGIVRAYKHIINSYQKETGHLNLMEHGAYRLMLDAYYATEKPLPPNREKLFRLVRAFTQAEKNAVNSIVAQFWEMVDGGLVNRFAAEQLERGQKQARINREIAIAREAAKKRR